MLRGIKIQEGFTAERIAELNALVSHALGALYDGGYSDIFVIHPAYCSIIEQYLTVEERLMVRAIEELVSEDQE